MRASVQDSELFDPAASDKRFRLSMTDLTQAIILPYVFERVRAEAPNTAIDCYQVRRREMNMELASGNLDLAADIPLTPDPHICQAPLFSLPHV